jgi:hypothetical protein
MITNGTVRLRVNETVRRASDYKGVRFSLSAKNRMENSGPVLIALIEMQTVNDLGEDKIYCCSGVDTCWQTAKK